MGPPQSARNEVRIGGKILVGADIEQDRALRRAHHPRKLLRGDRVD
jgi:hypothetical protein